jgi:DNA repair exonuclease SbcCD nuclease subunit
MCAPVKISLVGDLHIQSAILDTFNAFEREYLDFIRANTPTFIIILGDILHTHQLIHVTPLQRAVLFLRAVSEVAPTFLLIGNHDRINNSDFCSDIHAFTALKGVSDRLVIVDTTTVHVINNYVFVLVPYVAPGRFKEALDKVAGWQNATCVFAHQECRGAKMGAIVSVDGDEWLPTDPVCYSGHIHDYQVVQRNWVYVGTPYMTNFGEDADKAIMTLTVSGYGSDMSAVRTAFKVSNSKKKLHWAAQDILDKRTVPLEFAQLDVKIIVHGTVQERKTVISNRWYKALAKKYKLAFKVVKSNNGYDTKLHYQQKTFDALMMEQLRDDDMICLHKQIMANK